MCIGKLRGVDSCSSKHFLILRVGVNTIFTDGWTFTGVAKS